jgi:F420-dependent oxidoreductase-like protein
VPRLACFLDPGRSFDEAVGRARLADSLGYDSAWVTHIAAREPLQVLAAYGHATERIGLGTGVVPIALRHPVLTAMEAATLDETVGGRLRLGIGVSHRITVEGWYGLSLDDPTGRMREYATVIRDLWEGGRADLEGEHFTAHFGFSGGGGVKSERIPLLFAALAPKMLRLAAELADGVVLWMCSPSYIRDVVRPTLDDALAATGRDPAGFEVVAAVPAGITSNVEAARDAFRAHAFTYTQLPFYRKAIAAGGHEDALAAADAGEPLPASFVDAMAGIGDADTVLAKVEEYRAAGVTLPALGPIRRHEGGLDVDGVLEALAPSR